ncbi:hypothetical protein Ami103574_14000 [Aminipila butyrica]|uniref:Adenosylcobinamide-phosphate guanylyltransferase n=1 Tax=Aminipila butyrica TaxID=433296 RepID=A0A858BYX3_9FIRM|nr:histidine phosphatase family protein [Aminipila butyrica]QIB70335.1 hypothetical protein Ami103574_14000 [Aminipila butyrica]
MEIIVGGVYQGKLDYVKNQFHIKEDEIFYCSRESDTVELDFSKKVIYGLEEFTYACTAQGLEASQYLREHEQALKDKILICADISQGVVPMDKTLRAWREMNGRALIYLCGQAQRVTRIFCGLPQVLKGVAAPAMTKPAQRVSYIHIIRHGTTEGNVKRWYYGQSDLPLLEEGKELLAALKADSIYPRVDGADFYTTGMLRTEETFQIIFGEQEHGVLEELREISFGDYERFTYEELKELPEYQQWISDETGELGPPNGESRQVFQSRVLQGFKKLGDLHQLKELSTRHSGKEAHSVVVCHGGVIAEVMADCFPEEDKHFYKWIPDPGHGYTLRMEDGKPVSYQAF